MFSMIFHETIMDIFLKLSFLVILIIMFITGYLYVQIIFYLLGLYYIIKSTKRFNENKSTIDFISTLLFGFLFIVIGYFMEPINILKFLKYNVRRYWKLLCSMSRKVALNATGCSYWKDDISIPHKNKGVDAKSPIFTYGPLFLMRR